MNGTVRVGVITFPVSYTGDYYSLNLLRVLAGFTESIVFITGEVGYRFARDEPKVQAIEILHTQGVGTLARIARFLTTQLRLAFELVRRSPQVDKWVFHNGGDVLVFALLSARLLRKRPILIVTGSPGEISRIAEDHFSGLVRALTRLSF